MGCNPSTRLRLAQGFAPRKEALFTGGSNFRSSVARRIDKGWFSRAPVARIPREELRDQRGKGGDETGFVLSDAGAHAGREALRGDETRTMSDILRGARSHWMGLVGLFEEEPEIRRARALLLVKWGVSLLEVHPP